MALKNIEFVEAAKALGFGDARIIIKHILPNIAGLILVVTSANFAPAILLETGLIFLGFGAQPPKPSWGSMIKEYYGYIIMDAVYLAFFPGIAIMLTVYAFNVVDIGLRDAFDVKTQNVTV
ncbi:ABC-type dipeptide/oligopeptide/nickel transport system permease subunit [Pedobacter sp. UYP30]|uniref:ABC transporter permease n=1 Tax=Pedobacter sp. UYP30 TaxID=1756400 RepID=UPI0033909B10